MPLSLPDALLMGLPEPMGSLARDGGVNFSVFSQHAQRMELCLFDTSGVRELRRYPLHGPHDGMWHGFLPGAGPGLVYGLRAQGPWAPEQGHRFNHHKLLLDPCAREIVGQFRWGPQHHAYEQGHPAGTRSFDRRDNATGALKARVAPPPQLAAGWHNAPRHRADLALGNRVLYELHVKGFTMQHPGIPPALRGRYAGLAHPAAVAHFKRLGVTTLSLLPVQYHLDEASLAARGAVNYWGYNTIGFFAADPRYAQQCDDPTAVADEFREMVATLHDHDLEVVLDVVYNHSAEGSEAGPSISLRGLDHAVWYRLLPGDHSHCENLTGCGNTLQLSQPRVIQFVLDSLRHWVQQMGVDGFRFDLAPVLGRNRLGFDVHAAFFTALRQDPVLNRVHLIAEPWDAAGDGYQLGRFPGHWLEWNDKFRDTCRRYWLGHAVGRGEFARRFTASSDLFHHGQRRPQASVNFIAVHDGFTLADVVRYAHKHNEANGEANRDGRDNEPSANLGVEGPTTHPGIRTDRLRLQRAMLATLVLAQGTPMLCAGDEIGNSQQGNNNAYNQDNPTGWVDWADADDGLADFVAELLALRASDPALHHDRWFQTRVSGPEERAMAWFAPTGLEMQVGDWHDAGQHALAGRIDGAVPGQPHHAAVLLVFNPEPAPLAFTLPAPASWRLLLDSSAELAVGRLCPQGAALPVPARALVVLREVQGGWAAAGASTPASTTAIATPIAAIPSTPSVLPPP